jgi:hypothetical protein
MLTLICLFSLSMTSSGVRFGAPMLNHALASTAVTGSVGLHRLTSRPSMSVTRSGTPSAPFAVACPVFQFGTAKRKKAQFSPHANVIGLKSGPGGWWKIV